MQIFAALRRIRCTARVIASELELSCYLSFWSATNSPEASSALRWTPLNSFMPQLKRANSLFGLQNTTSLPSKSPKIPLCRNSNEQTARLGYKIQPFCLAFSMLSCRTSCVRLGNAVVWCFQSPRLYRNKRNLACVGNTEETLASPPISLLCASSAVLLRTAHASQASLPDIVAAALHRAIALRRSFVRHLLRCAAPVRADSLVSFRCLASARKPVSACSQAKRAKSQRVDYEGRQLVDTSFLCLGSEFRAFY